MCNQEFVQAVSELVKTEAFIWGVIILFSLIFTFISVGFPHNETSVEDWIEDGDVEGMTPQQVADEWDEMA